MHLGFPSFHERKIHDFPHETNTVSPDYMTASLRASVRDGIACGVMIGSGEAFFPALAIAAHANAFQIGLIGTLPVFVGSLLQLVGLYLAEHWRRRRSIVMIGASIQALCFIPLSLMLLLGPDPEVIIAVVACAYAGAGLGGPAWNSLIGDLVPASRRGTFFSRRNGWAALATFAATLCAGQILGLAEAAHSVAWGFFAIFMCAGAARLVSIRALGRHEEPPYDRMPGTAPSRALRELAASDFGRFVIFFSSLHMAAAISGPFFALYMLRDLKLTYVQFTIVNGAAIISQFSAMRFWGPVADRVGSRRVMSVCGYSTALVPILWLVNETMTCLILIQIVAGFIWAGFNLAAGNFLFDAVTPEHRAQGAALQGITQGAFVLAGSLLGALLISRLPALPIVAPSGERIFSSALTVFLISGILRFGAAAVLVPRLSYRLRAEKNLIRQNLFPLEQRKPKRSWNTDLEVAAQLMSASLEAPL